MSEFSGFEWITLAPRLFSFATSTHPKLAGDRLPLDNRSVDEASNDVDYGSSLALLTADTDAFVAAFSNIGPQIDVTGPGVGVVSTFPENTYGVMSGTSMACPAVAGMAAYLLASTPAILKVSKSARVQGLKEALFTSCRRLGFGRDYEGFGLPAG